jgi:hypothetical protein
MPPDVAEPQLSSNRTNITLPDWAVVATAAGDRTWGHPASSQQCRVFVEKDLGQNLQESKLEKWHL